MIKKIKNVKLEQTEQTKQLEKARLQSELYSMLMQTNDSQLFDSNIGLRYFVAISNWRRDVNKLLSAAESLETAELKKQSNILKNSLPIELDEHKNKWPQIFLLAKFELSLVEKGILSIEQCNNLKLVRNSLDLTDDLAAAIIYGY